MMSRPEHLLGEKLDKLEEWQRRGVNPYPYTWKRSHRSSEVVEQEAALTEKEVSIAGRLVTLRGHGKTSFAHVQDADGRMQVYARRDDLGEEAYELWKLLEVGDIVGVTGVVFRTRTDELTVRVQSFELLSKSLRPLPDKWHGLSDKEVRYRQRYVDLIVSPEVRDVFFKRSQALSSMRQFLSAQGFLEVETPVLQPLYGGASARPFSTHHNALDFDFFLRIAPELYLKRLVVGGFDGVFEVARNFRNEGMDRSHNPEFTMMELYVAYWDYEDMMRLTEDMLRHVAQEVTGATAVTFGDNEIDFGKPFARLPYMDALASKTGESLRDKDADALRAVAQANNVHVDADAPRGKILDDLFSELVEHELIQPTFVTDYPKEISPLAKDHRSESGLVERFELFVSGMELANAFSELNDPLEQRQRFEAQVALRAGGDLEAQPLDEDYLRALEYGMPPAGGLGMGVDRMVMLLTNSSSIRDVLLFPAMRPELGDASPEASDEDAPQPTSQG